MTTITNNLGCPFDIQTLQGPRVLAAFGTMEADFDPAYLELICSGGYISQGVVVSVKVEEQKSSEPSAEDEPTQEEIYEALSGKTADKRWSESRLAAEIAKLKKD